MSTGEWTISNPALTPEIGGGVVARRVVDIQPDAEGVLFREALTVPSFSRGSYFAAIQANDPDDPEMDWWPDAGNRSQPLPIHDLVGLKRGGTFLLLELEGGGFFALLPLAGAQTFSWLASDGDALQLQVGTLGAVGVSGDLPLYAWVRADDAYDACRRVWQLALEDGRVADGTRLREEKEYPEIMRYLGWCSWEAYRDRIDAELITGVIQQIDAHELPIRFVMVDDGHLDFHLPGDAAPSAPLQAWSNEGPPPATLLSFQPNAKFAAGWEPLLALRRHDGVRWMGLWLNFNGYWKGIDPNHHLGDLASRLTRTQAGTFMPGDQRADALAFYRAMLTSAGRDGFDFYKVDNQARALALYAGTKNPVVNVKANAAALEEITHTAGKPLLNCMAHSSVNVFNTRHSAVTRSSQDYEFNAPERTRRQIHNAYGNVPWMGQTVWCDHDIFHSCDRPLAGLLARSAAMSGGPVCLSDPPERFDPTVVWPLCYGDGEVLRPLAPGAPLPESLFVDPFHTEQPYRVIAPLRNAAAAVVLYNLTEPVRSVQGWVSPEDYSARHCMLSPAAREADSGPARLLVYNWATRVATPLSEKHTVALDGFTDALLLLIPRTAGWGVIGRVDKYLAPVACETQVCDQDRLTIRLVESGPLAIWNDSGSVHCDNAEFRELHPGLWLADLPMGRRGFTLEIFRHADRSGAG